MDGSTSAIRVATGRLERMDRPRSPTTKWLSEAHSCTGIGRSSPWLATISWISASLKPFCGSRNTLVTGSPGNTLTTMKVKTKVSRITTRAWARRLAA